MTCDPVAAETFIDVAEAARARRDAQARIAWMVAEGLMPDGAYAGNLYDVEDRALEEALDRCYGPWRPGEQDRAEVGRFLRTAGPKGQLP